MKTQLIRAVELQTTFTATSTTEKLLQQQELPPSTLMKTQLIRAVELQPTFTATSTTEKLLQQQELPPSTYVFLASLLGCH